MTLLYHYSIQMCELCINFLAYMYKYTHMCYVSIYRPCSTSTILMTTHDLSSSSVRWESVMCGWWECMCWRGRCMTLIIHLSLSVWQEIYPGRFTPSPSHYFIAGTCTCVNIHKYFFVHCTIHVWTTCICTNVCSVCSAFSALEQRGKLLRHYTQNIDTLEHTAGISRVVYCHGMYMYTGLHVLGMLL